MNFTESFEQFSSKLSTTDLALYAGIGLVLWVVFKERLSPVQQLLMTLVNKVRGMIPSTKSGSAISVDPPKLSANTSEDNQKDVFFKLVVSWKQTRDLAVMSGCSEAVKVADQMFPFLSPSVCKKENKNE